MYFGVYSFLLKNVYGFFVYRRMLGSLKYVFMEVEKV